MFLLLALGITQVKLSTFQPLRYQNIFSAYKLEYYVLSNRNTEHANRVTEEDYGGGGCMTVDSFFLEFSQYYEARVKNLQ